MAREGYHYDEAEREGIPEGPLPKDRIIATVFVVALVLDVVIGLAIIVKHAQHYKDLMSQLWSAREEPGVPVPEMEVASTPPTFKGAPENGSLPVVPNIGQIVDQHGELVMIPLQEEHGIVVDGNSTSLHSSFNTGGGKGQTNLFFPEGGSTGPVLILEKKGREVISDVESVAPDASASLPLADAKVGATASTEGLHRFTLEPRNEGFRVEGIRFNGESTSWESREHIRGLMKDFREFRKRFDTVIIREDLDQMGEDLEQLLAENETAALLERMRRNTDNDATVRYVFLKFMADLRHVVQRVSAQEQSLPRLEKFWEQWRQYHPYAVLRKHTAVLVESLKDGDRKLGRRLFEHFETSREINTALRLLQREGEEDHHLADVFEKTLLMFDNGFSAFDSEELLSEDAQLFWAEWHRCANEVRHERSLAVIREWAPWYSVSVVWIVVLLMLVRRPDRIP